MNATAGSVFLSYASDDAAAALRICTDLRAAGIDVWFDQSELRGGDAWDQAIRRRVKDCALFIPVISARTNARSEGYFRLEWRLAVDRSHLMADDQAFIVPVVIDDTLEADARVPDRFRERQWSRLRDGAVTAEFIATVRRLMAGDAAATAAFTPSGRPTGAAPKVAVGPMPVPGPAGARAPRRRALVPVLVAAALVVGGLALGARFLAASRTAPEAAPIAGDAPAAVSSKSIAVLPFLDMSEKKDQEYFSDGLAEELLSLLAQVPDLHVAARTSSFTFKGKSSTVADIAQALHVAHVLEGSVRKSGNTLRITVQLIRAADGFDLWSQTYDRDIRDVFKVQDEIAGAVVGALKARLLTDQQKAEHHLTDNADAHAQYLLGLTLLDRDLPKPVGEAIDAFHRAIAGDPNFAAAYSGLARAEQRLAEEVTGDPAGMARAAAAADRAIALAPRLAEGYVARASLRTVYLFDWNGAHADLDKALALAPSNDSAFNLRAYLYGAFGRMPEAIAAAQRSVELAPFSVVNQRTLILLLIDDGRMAEAEAEISRLRAIGPAETANGLQALILIARGDLGGAKAVVARVAGESDMYSVVTQALLEAATGNLTNDGPLDRSSPGFPFEIVPTF